MNTGSISMVRVTLVIAIWALFLRGFAQDGDGSLTKDFSKLSAKERTKIAMRETKEAAADSGYQAVMRRADGAFQAREYEKALADFEQARALRPYNVYPKVKIQDLQALIKKRDAERAALQSAKDAAIIAVADTLGQPAEGTLPSKEAEVPVITPVIMDSPAIAPSAPPSVTPVTKVPVTGNADPSQTADRPLPITRSAVEAGHVSPEEAVEPPLALGERVFMEAGSVVTERVVEDDGRATVYRRVVHSTGLVFVFKDGISVPERVWDDRFPP